MASNSTDRAWRKFGEIDPYFGVLSQQRFRRKSITEEDRQEFFRSGDIYVQQMLSTAHRYARAPQRFGRVLDFGCGVGRLTLPLARHADEVVGIDVSPAMLSEAKNNCGQNGVTNAVFFESSLWLNQPVQKFDLVHTFIVMQHIPPRRGLPIITRLVDHIADGGVGVIHLTYGKANPGIRLISWMKKWVPMGHNVINMLRGRSFFAPMMQMNDYDLNQVLRILQEVGVTDFHAQYTDHGSYLGVSLFFKKPDAVATASQAA